MADLKTEEVKETISQHERETAKLEERIDRDMETKLETSGKGNGLSRKWETETQLDMAKSTDSEESSREIRFYS